MAYKGTSCFVKCLVVAFNILFLICGMGIIGFAVYTLVQPNILENFLHKSLVDCCAYFLLGFGGLVVILSFFGCAGAALENRCLLIMFFTLMCGIFFSLLVFGILAAAFWTDLDTYAQKELSQKIRESYGADDKWTSFIDLMQSGAQCCGIINGTADIFQRSPWQNNNVNKKLPNSCCKMKQDGSYENLQHCTEKSPIHSKNSYMHSKACATAMKDLAAEYKITLMVIVIVIGLLLIFGMSFTLALLRGIVHYEPVENSY